jgi:hypothetical protein
MSKRKQQPKPDTEARDGGAENGVAPATDHKCSECGAINGRIPMNIAGAPVAQSIPGCRKCRHLGE